MTGVPLLPALFANARVAVEVAFGADLTDTTGSGWTWTDISADVLMGDGRRITITVGRADERSIAQPATCTFTLKNFGGAYTPFNALSSNWPNVARNTPVRVRVSLNGGSSWTVRFQGYADGFSPSWDESTRLAVVQVSASGISRRPKQGKSAQFSIMRRAALSTSTIGNVACYWPCEDGSSSTVLASGLPGALPLQPSAAGSSFASYTGFGGSAPLFVFGSGVNLSAPIRSTVDTTGKIYFRCLLHTPAGLTDQTVMMAIYVTGSTVNRYDVVYGTGGTLAVTARSSSGASLASTGANAFGIDNKKYYMSVELVQSGGNIAWLIAVNFLNDDNSVTNTFQSGTLASLQVGRASAFAAGGSGTMSGHAIGHIGIANTQTWLFSSSNLLTGYAGEDPIGRMLRLCTDENILFTTVGFFDTARILMGSQRIDTFTNLTREAEVTDAGFLYDGLDLGYLYQSRDQRYDQAASMTLDATAHHLLGDLTPADDDQRNRNLVTVTRTNGASAVAQDTTGPLGTNEIGTYDTTVQVNTVDDTGLYNRASWEVHAGTVQGLRYPTLAIDIMRVPSLATSWLTVTPGSRIDVTNISSVATQHPVGTVSLVVEGWTEQFHSRLWSVVANCSQNDVYDVQKIGDTRLGRLQTGGSALVTAASASATSLTVVTTGQQLWTTTATYPGDFNFDVAIDGIQVTVSAIGSVLTDAFGRTVSSGFGSADTGQAYSTSGGSATDYNVSAGVGTILLGSVNASRQVSVGAGWVDMDAQVVVRVPALATGAALDCGLQIRKIDTSNYYDAELQFATSGAIVLRFSKNVAASFTTGFASVTLPYTYSGASSWNLRAQIFGTALAAKAWPVGSNEPGWALVTTDSSLSASGGVGVRAIAETGNTNTTPTFSVDNLAVTNPQAFTVTGVTKALAAGKAVKTWKGGVIKL